MIFLCCIETPELDKVGHDIPLQEKWEFLLNIQEQQLHNLLNLWATASHVHESKSDEFSFILIQFIKQYET